MSKNKENKEFPNLIEEIVVTAPAYKTNFTRYGDNKEFNAFAFSGLTPFGKVVNEFMHPLYLTNHGYSWSDFDPDELGRYILGNDTLYWAGKYKTQANPYGVAPNLGQAKNNFYKNASKRTTGAIYNQNDKNTLYRIRKEAKQKKLNGGNLNSLPIYKTGNTTYTQNNDSTFTWNGPNNSAGTIKLYPKSGKEPEVTYRQYDRNTGEKVLVNMKDPVAKQKHIDNVTKGNFQVPGFLARLWHRARGIGQYKQGNKINYLNLFN